MIGYWNWTPRILQYLEREFCCSWRLATWLPAHFAYYDVNILCAFVGKCARYFWRLKWCIHVFCKWLIFQERLRYGKRYYTVHLFEIYVYMNYFLDLWVSRDSCVTMYQNEVRVTYLSYSTQTIYSYQNMPTIMLHVTTRHNVHIAGWHMMSKRAPLATSYTSCTIVFKMLTCKIK
jgi:hypothetical protein